MGRIRILDCTLRDGGYVNSWEFGHKTIQGILEKLMVSHVDIIEMGFVNQQCVFNENKTIFPSPEAIRGFLPENVEDDRIALMINYGDYDIQALPACSGAPRIIRVAFHKEEAEKALAFCKQLKEKGYMVFIQPMATINYSDEELLQLIKTANSFCADAFYIVDSFGTLKKNDVLRMFYIVDHNLDPQISIGFHSHNNLQLSFSNAQELLNIHVSRQLIMDSSVYGMGRGAGNLCTELVANYVNENKGSKYDLVPILEIVDDYLNAIFLRTPWGYSASYYVASINYCHPNYATDLMDRQTLGVKDINKILMRIPEEKRHIFDKQLIENLYIAHQKYEIDDSASLERIQDMIDGRNILVLAPGKSLLEFQPVIKEYILQNSPFVLAINFLSATFQADAVFFSNVRRFEKFAGIKVEHPEQQIIVTSNLCKDSKSDFMVINYLTLVDEKQGEMDNAGLMALRLLKKLGKSSVAIAGFDGFQQRLRNNYYTEDLVKGDSWEVIDAKNKSITQQINELSAEMSLDFLTPSLYHRRTER